MNIVIPCAGSGSRFSEAGYTRPKPFIETSTYGDIPMIARVLESLKDLEFFNAKLILIMQKDHLDNGFCSNMREWLDGVIRCYWKGYYKIIEINGPTSGAVSTTLLASKYLMNDEELIITNSDQYLHSFDIISFINYCRNYDGCLLTFPNENDNKWSYCEVKEYNNERLVDRVVEKEAISSVCNIGMYYFASGLLYLNAATQMITKNIRTNGEFYIAPIYNELCRLHRISHYEIPEDCMVPMGTPFDLKDSIERMDW